LREEFNVQIQPNASLSRIGRVQRARQAASLSEDAFKGGSRPQRRLPLKSPWRLGLSRLFEQHLSEAK
jgi:hypothetical protein